MISVRETVKKDISVVACKLRESDVKEVARATGQTPVQALTTGFEIEGHCWTMLVDDEPEAIFGLAEYGKGKHRPWFLTSDEPVKHKQEFMRVSIDMVKQFKKLSSFMENYVDAENTVAVEWLKKIGFHVEDKPVIIGVVGSLFYRFSWRKE